MSKKAAVEPITYYVYTYAFPDGTVFYVGKGCNARIDQHEREARSDCMCQKCCIIRQIWAGGDPVQKRIVYETFEEHEAFAQEYLLIQTYGLANLVNITKGIFFLSTKPATDQKIVSKQMQKFDFTSGRLCLDFINTVEDRVIVPQELLTSYSDLVAWGQPAHI